MSVCQICMAAAVFFQILLKYIPSSYVVRRVVQLCKEQRMSSQSKIDSLCASLNKVK